MKSINSSIDSKFLAQRLRTLIKGDVHDDKVTRLLYSTDGSIYRHVPMVVVCPRDEADVVRVMLFARETNVPIAPRGAGTGLAGESLTTGILIDFSRYMNKILEWDFDAGWVIAEPGVVLDDINRLALQHGMKFGPDPSSASRATVGGTISNNATGAHSLRYGYSGDNVLGLNVVLADGQILQSGTSEWTGIERKIFQKLNFHKRSIEENWPSVKRNRAGYNLKGMIERNGGNLLKLFPGSEGTLGLITRAKLKLVKNPPVRLLLTANFDEFSVSAKATNTILEFDPSAVELMDGILIRLARQSDENLAKILPDSQASLMAEFDGDTLDEAMGKLKRCCAKLKSEYGHHVQLVELIDPDDQKQQWSARKNAVPILYKQPGKARPLPIVEDSAVDPEKLPEYMHGMQNIFEKYGLDATFYGHAGSGEFHIRPYLNLRESLERKKLQNLGKDAYDLVWSLGGTISGEHGSGILRSWALRKQYGELYDLMETIKQMLDPEMLLNPGKIIVDDTELPIDNLRADLVADESRNKAELNLGDETLFDLADLCNGCGECKSYNREVMMCPIFRSSGDEYAAPRAKANLMREFLSGELSVADLDSEPVKFIIDNCLLCGNCLLECPSAVNIPQMVIELRALRRKLHGGKLVERVLVEGEYLEWMMSKVSPIANYFMKKKGILCGMEKVLGLDSGHGMPNFAFPGLLSSLRRLAAKHRPENPKVRALWFVDLFARYHDNQLARDIVKVCAANDIELIVPEQCGSDMPALAYGYVEQAKKSANFNINHLAKNLDKADVILSFEPTATLCLTEEYGLLAEDTDAFKAVAEKTYDGCHYLWQLHQKGELKKGEVSQAVKLGYHMPCHLRRLKCGESGYNLLGLIEGVKLEKLANSCCGLSGTFGMKAQKAELSNAIGQASAESALKGGYDMLTTECSACQMQLEYLTKIKAFHPVHFLAKWYGN